MTVAGRGAAQTFSLDCCETGDGRVDSRRRPGRAAFTPARSNRPGYLTRGVISMLAPC